MTRLLSLFVLVLFNISQICAQSSQTYVLKKPGTLQKMMKGNEGVKKLSISGVFNEKDLKFITSLPNLKVLDIKDASLSPKADLTKLREGKHRCILKLDTLKGSDDIRFAKSDQKFLGGKRCLYSYCRIIYPRYFVAGNDVQVNYLKECINNEYVGIDIFPEVPLISKDHLYISGTLYLKDATYVDNYFNFSFIDRIVFSKKIQRIYEDAFSGCHYLDDVIFEDGTDVEIEKRAFPYERIGTTYETTKLKRIRVPYGQIEKFVSMGFPRYIMIDKTPDIKLEVEVKTPGGLAEQLGNVDLRLIQSLRIKGILNSDDFSTINKMLSLEKLDLKDAFVYVPIAEKKADAADVAFLLGMANEAQYQKDGNYLNYELRNELNEWVVDGYDKTITCELPRNAFLGNPMLECLQLPVKLSAINRAGIGGRDGFSLAEKTRLKEIWISKASAEKIPIKNIVEKSKPQIKYY